MKKEDERKKDLNFESCILSILVLLRPPHLFSSIKIPLFKEMKAAFNLQQDSSMAPSTGHATAILQRL